MTLPPLDLIGPLFGHFLLLSLLAIGGAISTAPEMHRWMVVDAKLIDDSQFASALAIAQAAPGPNVMFVPLLGLHAAGFAGAAAAMIGIMLPSTTLSLVASRWGHANAEAIGVRAFKLGMAPITVALVAATGWLLAAPLDWRGWAVAAAVAVIVWRTRLHLLLPIAAGAVIGMLGWV